MKRSGFSIKTEKESRTNTKDIKLRGDAVLHGKWIHRTTWDKFVCSACSFEQDERSNFCPHCGAKMKE